MSRPLKIAIFAIWHLGLLQISCVAETLRVGFPSLATGFAPSWVTTDKGIWKKHDLDVELIFLRGGSRTVSALIGGSVDFILGSDLGVTTAIVQGASIARVGVTTNTLGYSMVTQPNIKTVRDLKGKIIGITPGRDAAYARVAKLLRDNGMDANKDVTYLAVGDGGPAARVAALSSGIIHATMFTLGKSRHEDSGKNRRRQRRRRVEHHPGIRAEKAATGAAFLARLHGRHSIFESS
jgi:ABC-type nitrate/sulfonate/bicarbonate transport system substrate-binding protein